MMYYGSRETPPDVGMDFELEDEEGDDDDGEGGDDEGGGGTGSPFPDPAKTTDEL